MQTVGEPVRYTVEVLLPAETIQYDATVVDVLPAGIDVAATGYTVSSTCEAGSAGSGVPCSVPVTAVELPPTGATVGWFLGDLTVTSSANRVLTIVYDATVDNVPAAADDVSLNNSVNVYANQTDLISGTPPAVPDSSSFDVSGDPDVAAVVVSEPGVGADQTCPRRHEQGRRSESAPMGRTHLRDHVEPHGEPR